MGARKFAKDLVTTSDGESGDIGRLLWAAGVASAIVFTGFAVYKSGTFDIQAYGIGFGVLLAAGAGALKLKESTENEPKDAPAAKPPADKPANG